MQYDENAEKYGYEGEMTPLKCDKLKAYKGDVTIPVYGTIADAEVYLKKEADEAIAELKAKLDRAIAERDGNQVCIDALKAKLEDVQASMYADVVDANMEIRRLKRALWITRTATAKSEKDRWNAHIDCGNRRNRKDPAYVKTGKLLETSEWRKLWEDIERKCRAKAEEYK